MTREHLSDLMNLVSELQLHVENAETPHDKAKYESALERAVYELEQAVLLQNALPDEF